jgi:micrococcal nuclease
VTVSGGVDGDTAHVKTREGKDYSVRFLSIDTPETHYNGKSQGVWGERATSRLQELLPVGTAVRLEFGPEVCDSNGRVLAHVFKGDMNVNEQMVREGWAVNYCIYPNVEYCEELGALTNQNIRDGRGFMGDPSMQIPYIWRREVSGREYTSYVGDMDSKEVFLPGHEDRVPVGNRMFFLKESDIEAPYHLVE